MYPGVNATNISIALTDSALAKAWVIYYSRRSHYRSCNKARNSSFSKILEALEFCPVAN